MTQRWRRKAVEVEAEYVDINPTAPWWVAGDPAYPHGKHITAEQFERDYEPVPSEPSEPFAVYDAAKAEWDRIAAKHEESLKLADELAEAEQEMQRCQDGRNEMSIEEWGARIRATELRIRKALSAYLESRKGKD